MKKSFDCHSIFERYPCWKWDLIDDELFHAVTIWHGYDERPGDVYLIEERVSWLANVLKEACECGRV